MPDAPFALPLRVEPYDDDETRYAAIVDARGCALVEEIREDAAAYIVRAVNKHQSLVDALRAIMQDYALCDAPTGDVAMLWRSNIANGEAALAEVDGE